MYLTLFSQEISYFDTFSKLGDLGTKTCQEFILLAAPGADIDAGVNRIHDLSNQALQVTQKSLDALYTAIVTPIDRRDIEDLIHALENAIGAVDAAGSHLTLYELRKIRPDVKTITEVLVGVSGLIAESLGGLHNLKNAIRIQENCSAIHRLKKEVDKLLSVAMYRLFKESDPVLMIKWQDIYSRLENASEQFLIIASVIDGILCESCS